MFRKTVAFAIVVVDGNGVAAGMPSLEPCRNWIDELGELFTGRNEFNAAKQLQFGDALVAADTAQGLVKDGPDVVSATRSDVLQQDKQQTLRAVEIDDDFRTRNVDAGSLGTPWHNE